MLDLSTCRRIFKIVTFQIVDIINNLDRSYFLFSFLLAKEKSFLEKSGLISDITKILQEITILLIVNLIYQ